VAGITLDQVLHSRHSLLWRRTLFWTLALEVGDFPSTLTHLPFSLAARSGASEPITAGAFAWLVFTDRSKRPELCAWLALLLVLLRILLSIPLIALASKQMDLQRVASEADTRRRVSLAVTTRLAIFARQKMLLALVPLNLELLQVRSPHPLAGSNVAGAGHLL
jgi:hypothetical protein